MKASCSRVALTARLLGLVLCCLLLPREARADERPATGDRATFALIIGSNQSVDTNLAPLRYADDDAARYLDLFRLLGARTYLLSRLDENTRRLHPQATAETLDPKKASFDVAVAQLIADVTQASQRGVETLVYFVYAGHGNVGSDGQGYITLEDLRITGADLAGIFARVPASRIHVIVDACASYFLAYSRGPGGERRPIASFGLAPALGADPRIGLLLSTSSARESHEWDAFQSGVFSHEVRSGLYGAADADGDGQVSYHEIGAFVARANEKIVNERYRPDVHARAPRAGSTLLDLRRTGRKLQIDGEHAGHYFLEDARGVRIADVHNAPDQTLSLVRPGLSGHAYLRRVDDDKEFRIESSPELVALADLTPEEPRSATRGAAHESFNALFALPFDRDVVEAYPIVPCEEPAPPPTPIAPRPRTSIRVPVGIGALALGGVAIGVGVVLSHSASNDYHIAGLGSPSQQATAEANERIATKETIAGALYVGGGIAIASGLVMLLWPTKSAPRPAAAGPRFQASKDGGYVSYGASF